MKRSYFYTYVSFCLEERGVVLHVAFILVTRLQMPHKHRSIEQCSDECMVPTLHVDVTTGRALPTLSIEVWMLIIECKHSASHKEWFADSCLKAHSLLRVCTWTALAVKTWAKYVYSLHLHQSMDHTLLLKLFEYLRSVSLVAFGTTYAKSVTDVVVASISRHVPGLHFLDLSHCTELTSYALETVASYCPQLTTVRAIECINVTNDGIVALGTKCKKLTELTIRGCGKITDDGVVQFARHCVTLRHIDIGSMTYRVSNCSVLALANNCPKLRSVDCYSMMYNSDEAVVALANKCPELRKVILTANSAISDYSIIKLVSTCKNLEDVSVGYTFVRMTGIWNIAQKCSALKYLDISGDMLKTDSCIVHVARTCRLLEHLNISLSTMATNTSVIAIAENCLRLKKLDVSFCTLIDDDGISNVAKCTALEELNVSGCCKVTSSSIEHLITSCKKSLSIHISCCDVTLEYVNNLRARKIDVYYDDRSAHAHMPSDPHFLM